MRLFNSLKGNAREAVQTVMATTSDAELIIDTLELQFGEERHSRESRKRYSWLAQYKRR